MKHSLVQLHLAVFVVSIVELSSTDVMELQNGGLCLWWRKKTELQNEPVDFCNYPGVCERDNTVID